MTGQFKVLYLKIGKVIAFEDCHHVVATERVNGLVLESIAVDRKGDMVENIERVLTMKRRDMADGGNKYIKHGHGGKRKPRNEIIDKKRSNRLEKGEKLLNKARVGFSRGGNS